MMECVVCKARVSKLQDHLQRHTKQQIVESILRSGGAVPTDDDPLARDDGPPAEPVAGTSSSFTQIVPAVENLNNLGRITRSSTGIINPVPSTSRQISHTEYQIGVGPQQQPVPTSQHQPQLSQQHLGSINIQRTQNNVHIVNNIGASQQQFGTASLASNSRSQPGFSAVVAAAPTPMIAAGNVMMCAGGLLSGNGNQGAAIPVQLTSTPLLFPQINGPTLLVNIPPQYVQYQQQQAAAAGGQQQHAAAALQLLSGAAAGQSGAAGQQNSVAAITSLNTPYLSAAVSSSGSSAVNSQQASEWNPSASNQTSNSSASVHQVAVRLSSHQKSSSVSTQQLVMAPVSSTGALEAQLPSRFSQQLVAAHQPQLHGLVPAAGEQPRLVAVGGGGQGQVTCTEQPTNLSLRRSDREQRREQNPGDAAVGGDVQQLEPCRLQAHREAEPEQILPTVGRPASPISNLDPLTTSLLDSNNAISFLDNNNSNDAIMAQTSGRGGSMRGLLSPRSEVNSRVPTSSPRECASPVPGPSRTIHRLVPVTSGLGNDVTKDKINVTNAVDMDDHRTSGVASASAFHLVEIKEKKDLNADARSEQRQASDVASASSAFHLVEVQEMEAKSNAVDAEDGRSSDVASVSAFHVVDVKDRQVMKQREQKNKHWVISQVDQSRVIKISHAVRDLDEDDVDDPEVVNLDTEEDTEDNHRVLEDKLRYAGDIEGQLEDVDESLDLSDGEDVSDWKSRSEHFESSDRQGSASQSVSPDNFAEISNRSRVETSESRYVGGQHSQLGGHEEEHSYFKTLATTTTPCMSTMSSISKTTSKASTSRLYPNPSQPETRECSSVIVSMNSVSARSDYPLSSSSPSLYTSTSSSSGVLSMPATSEPVPGSSRSNALAPGTSRSSTLAPGSSRSSTLAPGSTRSSTFAPGLSRNNTLAPTSSRSNTLAPGSSKSSTLAPGSTRLAPTPSSTSTSTITSAGNTTSRTQVSSSCVAPSTTSTNVTSVVDLHSQQLRSPMTIHTVEELQSALACDRNVQLVVSNELLETPEFVALIQNMEEATVVTEDIVAEASNGSGGSNPASGPPTLVREVEEREEEKVGPSSILPCDQEDEDDDITLQDLIAVESIEDSQMSEDTGMTWAGQLSVDSFQYATKLIRNQHRSQQNVQHEVEQEEEDDDNEDLMLDVDDELEGEGMDEVDGGEASCSSTSTASGSLQSLKCDKCGVFFTSVTRFREHTCDLKELNLKKLMTSGQATELVSVLDLSSKQSQDSCSGVAPPLPGQHQEVISLAAATTTTSSAFSTTTSSASASVKEQKSSEDQLLIKMEVDNSLPFLLNNTATSSSTAEGDSNLEPKLEPTVANQDPLAMPGKHWKCGQCKEVFGSGPELLKHLDTFRNAKIKCHACHIIFQERSEMIAHASQVHNYNGESEDTFGDTIDFAGNHRSSAAMMDESKLFAVNTLGEYTCSFCDRAFKDLDSLKKHLTCHSENNPFECLQCGRRFLKLNLLKRHSMIHTGQKNFQCVLCYKKFFNMSKLREHMRIHTGEAPLKCDICGKGFKRHSNLSEHRRIHDPNRVVKPPKELFCRDCGQMFTTKRDLDWHTEKEHQKAPKKCPHCGEVFIHSRSLTKHIKVKHDSFYVPQEKKASLYANCPLCDNLFYKTSINKHIRVFHHGVKSFTCEICSRSFVSKHNLDVHVWQHKNKRARPFKCNLCNKAYLREALLKEHMNSHKMNKPYVCNECGVQFSMKHNWKRHVEEHQGSRRYHCQECDKSFSRSYYLTDHMKVHSGHKPYICGICGKTTATRSNYNSHLRTHVTREPLNSEV